MMICDLCICRVTKAGWRFHNFCQILYCWIWMPRRTEHRAQSAVGTWCQGIECEALVSLSNVSHCIYSVGGIL